MSTQHLYYCAPHDERFSVHCPRCAKDWYASLTKIEQALVDRHQDHKTVDGCKKLIQEFRKMEAA